MSPIRSIGGGGGNGNDGGEESHTIGSSSTSRRRGISFSKFGGGGGGGLQLLRRRRKKHQDNDDGTPIDDEYSNDNNNNDNDDHGLQGGGGGGGGRDLLQRIDSGDSLVVAPQVTGPPESVPRSSSSTSPQPVAITSPNDGKSSPVTYWKGSKATANGNSGGSGRTTSSGRSKIKRFFTSSSRNAESNSSMLSNNSYNNQTSPRSGSNRSSRPTSPRECTTPTEVLLHNPILYHNDAKEFTSLDDPSNFRRGYKPRRRMLLWGLKQDASTRHLQPSFLSSLGIFKRLSDWAFDVVDADKSGFIDEKEFYSGLLLIHLQLGQYTGMAACKAVSREQAHVVFKKMDADDSGTLDKEEFEHVMMILFGNVLFRIVIQYSLTLLIVPLLAQLILDTLYHISYTTLTWYGILSKWYMDLVESASTIAASSSGKGTTIDGNDGEEKIVLLFVSATYPTLQFLLWIITKIIMVVYTIYQYITPYVLQATIQFVVTTISSIPPRVKNTLDIVFVSTVLGILVVPYCLMKIDDLIHLVLSTTTQRGVDKTYQNQSQSTRHLSISPNPSSLSK